MASSNKLLPKQKKFVKEYLIDLNGKQAAIRAKYSPKTAEVQASRLLSNAKVQEEIQTQQSKRLERIDVNADYVLKRLVDIDAMDVLDIMDDKMNIKAISEWPKCWRQTISGLDLMEIKDKSDTEPWLKKIKWPDKVKNLELIGKHINVQAFKEKVELDGELTLNNLITDISKINAEQRSVLPKMADNE